MATSAVIFDTERVGLVGEKWKLIRSGRREELYRRDGPAPEAEDLAPSQKRRVAKLAVVLDRMLERCPLNVIDESEINPELLQTLQQLGYVE